jgi:hypothetical protein
MVICYIVIWLYGYMLYRYMVISLYGIVVNVYVFMNNILIISILVLVDN